MAVTPSQETCLFSKHQWSVSKRCVNSHLDQFLEPTVDREVFVGDLCRVQALFCIQKECFFIKGCSQTFLLHDECLGGYR